MAQTMTTGAAGRVNRRFLLLALILAGLFAVLAYTALSSNGGGGSTTTDQIPIVVAKVPIPAGTRITDAMIELADFPADRVSASSISDVGLVVGQVARYNIEAQEPLYLSKVASTTVTGENALAYVVEDGMRGEAITVQQVVTAGGLLLPGDHADVLWIPFSGGPAFRLLSDVEVTAVQQTIVDIQPVAPGVQGEAVPTPAPGVPSRVRASDALPQPDAQTVTMLLSPDDSKTLFCADDFALKYGGEIRLAVRSFGDGAPAQIDAPECPPTDLLLEFQAQQ